MGVMKQLIQNDKSFEFHRKPMIFGYVRVSTKFQSEKFGLESQIRELVSNGCPENHIIKETATGTTTKRPAFRELVDNILQDGDVLMCTRMDRFARSLKEGTADIEKLIEKGVTIQFLNFPAQISNKPTDKLVYQMFLAMAEFDRNLIIERMKEGRAVARTKDGFREGRRPKDLNLMRLAVEELKKHTYTEVCNTFGIARSTLFKYKKIFEGEKQKGADADEK